MENEEYLCINCAKKIECYGPDIKLEEPDLCIPIYRLSRYRRKI